MRSAADQFSQPWGQRSWRCHQIHLQVGHSLTVATAYFGNREHQTKGPWQGTDRSSRRNRQGRPTRNDTWSKVWTALDKQQNAAVWSRDEKFRTSEKFWTSEIGTRSGIDL